MTLTNWENITNYIESVGTTDKTIPFSNAQESVKVTNKGGVNLTYTIGSQTGTLTPRQSVTVNETISSITIRAASGLQAFEVWGVEKGTEKTEPETDFAAQLTDQETVLSRFPRVTGETDDTARFSRAISSLASKGGGTLLIPYGTYTVTSVVFNTVHNVTVLNFGTIKASSAVLKFFEVKDCNNFKMVGGTIDGSRLVTRGVSLINCPRHVIENVYVKDIGNDALLDSAGGIWVGRDSDYGYIVNCKVEYVHAETNNSAGGIIFSVQDSAVSDDNRIPKHCTVDNCEVIDVAPRGDGDGLKILSAGLIDADLVVKNSRFINCLKRGIKFQACGCKSINNYVEFYQDGSTGIDFQRGNGSSINDTIVNFTPVVDNSPLIYSVYQVAVGNVRITNPTYLVKNDTTLLYGDSLSSSFLRLYELAASGYTGTVDNVVVSGGNIQGCPKFIWFEKGADNLQLIHNTIELIDDKLLNASVAVTLTNLVYKNNKINYRDTFDLQFVNTNITLSSGDIDVQDSTNLMILSQRSNDLRIRIIRSTHPHSRSYEQFKGVRTHYMPAIPSSYGSSSGLFFNYAAVGDKCVNTNQVVITDAGGDYVISQWVCTVAGPADGGTGRGTWKAMKQLVI